MSLSERPRSEWPRLSITMKTKLRIWRLTITLKPDSSPNPKSNLILSGHTNRSSSINSYVIGLTAKGAYLQMFHCLGSLASRHVNILCLTLHLCSKDLCTYAFCAEVTCNQVMLDFYNYSILTSMFFTLLTFLRNADTPLSRSALTILLVQQFASIVFSVYFYAMFKICLFW